MFAMSFNKLAAPLCAALCVAGFSASAADLPRSPTHLRHAHVRHAHAGVAHARSRHVRERIHYAAASSLFNEVHYASPYPLVRGFSGALPSCADPGVQARIQSSFASREREYWSSGLELSSFTHYRELGYRSWGPEFVPRRFCGAEAYTSDGRRRGVYWLVADSQGFAGVGTGVEWCVTGLDRSYAFAPNCKMARP